ncbi:HAD family hydrolase [Catenuloplanes japonicus]|uniref:HAD family hydrolase n=1 Tax=Catenuloplanes japonicus TaxID=33876 RepID=UPI00068CADF6|nr:HAD family hydrolase [Catenuloplanes japonicus]
MLRGVVFDFNGTLAELASTGRPHRDVFAAHGLAHLGARWGEAWDHAPEDGARHEAASRSAGAYHRWELDRLRADARRLGVPAGRVDALVTDLDRETKAMTMRGYADAAPAVAALEKLGLRLAVCSNWYWDLDRAISQSGLDGAAFTAAVTSARAGMRKPDPRIYRITLDACGLTPAETLFVGDVWGPDVAGPRAVGMRAAHLCRSGRETTAPEPGVWRVGGLAQVVTLAGELRC